MKLIVSFKLSPVIFISIDGRNASEIVEKAIQEGINLANNDSESNAKKVQKWRILRKDFSVPGGELGPTLKMKRHIVMKQYAELVDGFYN